MKVSEVRYFIENGRLYCEDEFFEPYEVVCSVQQFLAVLDTEEDMKEMG